MRKRAHTSGLPSRTPPAPHPHRGSGLRIESPVLLLQMGRLHRPSSARPAPRMCVSGACCLPVLLQGLSPYPGPGSPTLAICGACTPQPAPQ